MVHYSEPNYNTCLVLCFQKTCFLSEVNDIPVVNIPKPPTRTPISCEDGSNLHIPPLPKRSLLSLPKNFGDKVRIIHHFKTCTITVLSYAYFIVGVTFSCRNIYLLLKIKLKVQFRLKRYGNLLYLIVQFAWFLFDTANQFFF